MTDTKFIIDADALIHAYRYDFPPDGNHGGFWTWLNALAQTVDIVIPESVIREINAGNDGLAALLHQLTNLKNEASLNCIRTIPQVLQAYGDLTEIDMDFIGNKADPYVIAHAIDMNATVVTNEIPQPGLTIPRNKKIPDICASLHVNYVRYPHFIWEMHQ
ncbi:MAG: DUF4411 family protein [Dehalococcoidales bacterium]|nr:DUF4411 family protein [Dehalococcoidales bacterium]